MTEFVSIGATVAALKGLDKVLSSITQGIREAFSVSGYQGYLQAVKRFGKDLAGELLTLQLSLGRMKVALAQAFAPIMEVVVPWINAGIQAVIRFSGTLRQFFAGLITGITGQESLAQSADAAADAENALKASATAAGKAVKRSLMGFDELNRLNGSSGSGTVGSVSFRPVEDTVSPQVQAIVQKVLAFLKPLLEIDLTPLKDALARLGEAISGLASLAGQAMGDLWQRWLTPFITWVAEQFAPALTRGMAATLEAVAAATAPVITGVQSLLTALEPVMAYIGENVIQALGSWEIAFEDLTWSLEESGGYITEIFQNIGQVISVLWAGVEPVLRLIGAYTQSMAASMGTAVGQLVGSILSALASLTEFVAGVFTGDWQRAWNGIKGFLKSIVNGIVGLLNTMISRIVSALNAVIRAANQLRFTVPSWVPGIGGKSFGVNMKTLSTPQIPYLAQGAVLPANKPFLAMVGDQRHGTNVEAPLATIQEAVAVVLSEQMEGMMAGIRSMVSEQRQTRAAVEGIVVGDSVIGRAARRYEDKMRLATGNLV